MRSLLAVSAAALLCLAGCQSGAGTTSPATPTSTASAAPVYALHAGGDSLVAVFDVVLDTQTLGTTLTPRRGAQAQPPQAQTFDLDIENFLRPKSLQLTGVTRDANGNVQVQFSHSHPFPAPDFAAGITSQNRADLGYTGRLMILSDGATQAFFGGTIRTDPTLVVDADGYLATGDLLATTGLSNNTFPYVLLADEAEDNRVGVSNGGLMHGSYDPVQAGWHQTNAGASNIGWTGFDYVHGGQTITNDFTLSSAVLASGTYEFSLAVLIKYTDPRGQGGRTRRFPPQPADVSAFAYRLPYAALDASKSSVAGPVFIGTAGGVTAALNVDLRDWDAAATMASGSQLGAESDVTLIEAGAAGEPVATLDAPALNPAEMPLLPAGGASGEPGDEIAYGGTITNSLGTATGTVYGLLRFTDPADANDDSGYHYGVDPLTIAADPNRALDIRTYQAVPISVGGGGTSPTISQVCPTGTAGCAGSLVMFSLDATNTPTSWSWNFGGGASPNTSSSEFPMVTLSGAGTYNGTVTATNGSGSSLPFPFSFTVIAGGGYQTHFVNQNAGGNSGYYPDAELYGCKPIVTSMRYDGASYHIELSSTAQTVPTMDTQWITTEVTSYAGTAPTLYQTSFQAMMVYHGRIVIAFNNDTTDRMQIAIANVTEPALPSGPADWTIYELDPVAVVGLTGSQTPDGVLRCSLTEHNGMLVVAYGDQSLDDCKLALANVDPPMSASDWSLITVEATGSRGPWTDVISYDDGTAGGNKLWIAHRDESGFNGHLSKCSVATPTGSAAEWTHFNIPSSSFGGRAAQLIGFSRAGQPRLLYIQSTWTSSGGGPALRVAVSNVQNPSGLAGDWTVYNIETYGSAISEMMGADVELVNGLPVIAFYDNISTSTTASGVLGIATALNSNIAGVGDWAVTFPEVANPSGCWPDLMLLAGGQPAVVHRVGARTSTPGNGMKFGVDLCN